MSKEKDLSEVNDPLGEYQKPLTFEKVWEMFQETDRIIKEHWAAIKERDRQMQETDRIIKEHWAAIRETDRMIKDTAKQMRETDKKIDKIYGLYSNQWGDLVESLVSGCLVKILNERGIMVRDAYREREGRYGNINYEFDLIAGNGKEIVVTEVKSTLTPKDVDHFLYKLAHIRTWIESYQEKTIYGAVAFLKQAANADKQAMNKGLLVIRATGDSASIINPEGFKPKPF